MTLGFSRNAYRAEGRKVGRHELAVEEYEAPTFRRATSHASATFDASVIRLNILSPKNARPSFTP